METPHLPAEHVHEMWLSTANFLKYNVARMADHRAQAQALADAEAQRVRDADLYWLDTAACGAAAAAPLLSCGLDKLVPSAAGLLVWSTPPAWVEGGAIPVVAATWGVAYDGGTWVSWWTHTRSAAPVLGGDPMMLVGAHGHLMYHQEAHVAVAGWPTQADDPGDPDHALYRSLLQAWTLIEAAGDGTPVDPAPAIRKELRRAGLPTRPVRRYTAPADGAVALLPQQAVRRTMAGHHINGRSYPGELPPELAPWHTYTREDGHCVLAVLPVVGELTTSAGAGTGRVTSVVRPVPVRALLEAGWHIGDDGHVHTLAVRFDATLGLMCDPEHREF